MKKWVCRLSIVCCLCLFFTSVKAQLSLGGLGDILNSSTVNKVVRCFVDGCRFSRDVEIFGSCL